MKIYISGPIKGHDDFVSKFAAAAREASAFGVPVNPVDIPACDSSPCRNPGELLPSQHTWECYMRTDIAELTRCDSIYMMRGWEKSKGAVTEFNLAVTLGLKVMFQPSHYDLEAMLTKQIEWSKNTFGPAGRLTGILDHICKELREVEEAPWDVTEWIDVVILALDGAWRNTGLSPSEIVDSLLDKYRENRERTWPDWREFGDDVAIEHNRTAP